jgi:hypothetical protein
MRKLSMLLTGLFLVSVLGLSTSYGQQVNDANAEKRNVTGFHGIRVSHAFDVYLSQSNEETVAVSAAETKFRDRIKVEVKSGILHVSYDNQGIWNTGNKKLKAYISFKNIDELEISGACDVVISGEIKANDLKIGMSGASDLKGKLDVKNLSVNLSGASDMTVTGGTATQLRIDASGASDFKGFDLITEVCDAEASGASDIKITVNKELSAQASGASSVHYKGEGVIKELKTSGASSVSKTRS